MLPVCQVALTLPSGSVAASVPMTELAPGSVREVIQPLATPARAPLSSRSGRWFSMTRTARYHGPRGGGHNVLNGALGVVNSHEDPVADCCTASQLRLIPSKGDSIDLPAFGQLGASVLCDDEVLLWSGADWKCHFCKLVASWVAGGPDLPKASIALKVVGRKNCCLQRYWPTS